MSYLSPIRSQNGCVITTTTVPGGIQGDALYISQNAGFGFTDLDTSKKFAIVVSEKIDYEISFWVRQPNSAAGFELSVKTFNSDFVETLTFDIVNGSTNRILIDSALKVLDVDNKWYFCRYILYSSTQEVVVGQQPKTSLSAGTNLIMSASTANLFVNLISRQVDGIHIWNFKIKPLRTPFSTGFLQPGHLLEIWRKNNNNALSLEQIDRNAQRYLLPNNTGQSVINL